MASSFSGFEEDSAWGTSLPETSTGDIIKDAIRKEKLVKDIAAAQEDLHALLSRVQTVQSQIDKLSSGNETLQMYIDNLTKQIARR